MLLSHALLSYFFDFERFAGYLVLNLLPSFLYRTLACLCRSRTPTTTLPRWLDLHYTIRRRFFFLTFNVRRCSQYLDVSIFCPTRPDVFSPSSPLHPTFVLRQKEHTCLSVVGYASHSFFCLCRSLMPVCDRSSPIDIVTAQPVSDIYNSKSNLYQAPS